VGCCPTRSDLRVVSGPPTVRDHTGIVTASDREAHMDPTILWIIAVVLVIAGIVALFRRQMILGIVLIVVGLLVGPGGVSIFS
jgi:hypothetical protein